MKLKNLSSRESVEYKDPVNRSGWRKPPIDEVLLFLIKICLDENYSMLLLCP